jgi:hypothetical protein
MAVTETWAYIIIAIMIILLIIIIIMGIYFKKINCKCCYKYQCARCHHIHKYGNSEVCYARAIGEKCYRCGHFNSRYTHSGIEIGHNCGEPVKIGKIITKNKTIDVPYTETYTEYETKVLSYKMEEKEYEEQIPYYETVTTNEQQTERVAVTKYRNVPYTGYETRSVPYQSSYLGMNGYTGYTNQQFPVTKYRDEPYTDYETQYRTVPVTKTVTKYNIRTVKKMEQVPDKTEQVLVTKTRVAYKKQPSVVKEHEKTVCECLHYVACPCESAVESSERSSLKRGHV